MTNFFTAKLGASSEATIRAIDAFHGSPSSPYFFDIPCSQVTLDLAVGDFLFIGFGSNNSKGGATDWVRGVRALGTVTAKSGGPRYGDSWVISVEIQVVLPESVTAKDLLKVDPVAYAKFLDIPVVGMGMNAQQTIQMINPTQPEESLPAFLNSLSAIHPSFRTDTLAAYPTLGFYFTYVSPGVAGIVEGALTTASLFAEASMADIVQSFISDATAASFRVKKSDVHRFIASLMSKRLLIATGLSGSGKTKLAQSFAAWLTPSLTAEPTKRYEVVSVGADWTSSENILGYPNGLDASGYISKPALDLILRAQDNPQDPYFLILDEMNLSHVERYFADVLSAIESGEQIHLHRDADRKADQAQVPRSVGLPQNLFIIGTVNVDETTYMFSPKVLDRANVIEFRISDTELSAFLADPAKPNIAEMAGKGAAFGAEFVKSSVEALPGFADPIKSNYEKTMLLFFKVLEASGSEFGYRVAHEAARFIQSYKTLGGFSDSDTAWLNDAFDLVVVQKFLPKLHGSRAKLGPLLKKLWSLCADAAVMPSEEAFDAAEAAARSTEKKFEPSRELPADAPFKVSAEKIGRMWRLLNDNGFTSFAEA